MKPSISMVDKVIEVSPFLEHQMPNILEDWCIAWEDEKTADYPQSFIDALFGAYVSGMLSVMNPNTCFNKKYNLKVFK